MSKFALDEKQKKIKIKPKEEEKKLKYKNDNRHIEKALVSSIEISISNG